MTTAPSDDREEISLDQVSIRRRLFNVRTMASLLFGLVLIYFLARIIFGDNFDWGEVAQLVGQADLGFLVLAFAMYYATFPLRGLRWQYILARSGMSIGLRDATEILFLSWFINCLVPAKLGDLYRAFLLRANYGASISRTLGTVFIERVADLIVIAVLALTAGFWSFRGRSAPRDRCALHHRLRDRHRLRSCSSLVCASSAPRSVAGCRPASARSGGDSRKAPPASSPLEASPSCCS